MANYAILRTKKLKTIQDVAGSGSHTFRLRDTPNADPSRLNLNQVLVGGKTNLLHRMVADRIEAGAFNARVRKDSVRAIEFILTASPEWFEKATQDQFNKWQEENIKWLTEKYGEANLASAVLHMDESSPHIHAHVVPITKDGRLSAKDLIGGDRKNHSILQTDYAKAMTQFGLVRGEEKSVAKHQDIKTYYQAVNESKQEKLKLPKIEKPPLFGRDEYVKKTRERVRKMAKSAKIWKFECQRLRKGSQVKATEEAEKKAKIANEKVRRLQDRNQELLRFRNRIHEEYERYKHEKEKENNFLKSENERLLTKNRKYAKENRRLKEGKTKTFSMR
ncbi:MULTISPECIES: MobV family relaxase [Halomonas]|uniref:MobV family relaxase n=1 Tax=Halomonas TaxID=2745 RepID=UPI0018673909|nr:MobV family relaxase [Halomonas citrativorans]